ncbi:hypothetical protein A5881_003629 [Enterococcus termitis]|nr:hypothetical protein A5881_000003 [Enterococcus termitis]
MCKVLGISRQTYYYQPKERQNEADLEELVEVIFNQSRKNYGTRKIKKELEKREVRFSRRRIGKIMKRRQLISSYTKTKFKPIKTISNETKIANKLNRQFSNRQPLEAIVTDLTYVRVGAKWHYICFILDLFNREIIGYSCGPNKDSALVKKELCRISYPLTSVHYFHTDRGKEFDNQAIEEILSAFQIERSFSRKGSPHDNAVAESTYKSAKVEFIYPNTFTTLHELEVKLGDYVHW